MHLLRLFNNLKCAFPLSKADLDLKPDDGNSQDKGPPDLLGEEVNMQRMIAGRNNDIAIKTRQCLFCVMQSSDLLLQVLQAHCSVCLCRRDYVNRTVIARL